MSNKSTPNTPPDPPPEKIEVVDLYQKQEKIYVRAFKGIYRTLRITGGAVLFLLYFGLCWVNWNGQQVILFDLPKRQFHLFGTTFWPQDFFLVAWLLIICAFGLFFITNLAGRIWCGYACPQSVFTWVFMWVEKITEGDRRQRIRLDKADWDKGKLLKKITKHILWLAIALLTGITFVGYFTPVRELVPTLTELNVSGWALFWIAFFTLATYGNAGWLREQVCIYMCPYARFQSVMFDQDTLVVSYDLNRGEKRGPRKKNADPKELGLGDCIDCQWCVQVCPTGIDIRKGLQYECIGCAACIDACDNIMEKMGYEKGLIKYTTDHNLKGGKTRIFRARLIGYFAVLVIMMATVAYSVINRVPLQFEALRDRNALYTYSTSGALQNVYMLKVANMDAKDHSYQLAVEGLKGLEISGSNQFEVKSGEVASVPLRLQIDPAKIQQTNNDIKLKVQSITDSTISAEADSRFIAPSKR